MVPRYMWPSHHIMLAAAPLVTLYHIAAAARNCCCCQLVKRKWCCIHLPRRLAPKAAYCIAKIIALCFPSAACMPQAPQPSSQSAPKPAGLGQDSWQRAAQAWRQKHMPTAHELRRAQQGRHAQQARPHADQAACSLAAGLQRGSRAGQTSKGSQPGAGSSSGTCRTAEAQGPRKQQRQQQQQSPQVPWRLLSESLPVSQLPQRGRQGWLREQHQRRVAGCVTFDAVLRAFG